MGGNLKRREVQCYILLPGLTVYACIFSGSLLYTICFTPFASLSISSKSKEMYTFPVETAVNDYALGSIT